MNRVDILLGIGLVASNVSWYVRSRRAGSSSPVDSPVESPDASSDASSASLAASTSASLHAPPSNWRVARWDILYGDRVVRAGQSVSPDDPIIRHRPDAF